MFSRLLILIAIATCATAVRAATPASELAEGTEPQLATRDATTYLVYGRRNEIRLATSGDAGRSFSPPAVIAALDHLALGMRRGPRIACAGDAIVVTAIADQRAPTHRGDLLAWRSINGGRTWQGPITVNDAAAAAREGLHHLASDGQRRLYAVWLDLRNGHTRVEGSLSRDAGVTWEANELIYDSPDGHTCECCQPSVVFRPDGRVTVMFRNDLAGNRDMYLATFTPGGAASGVKVQPVDRNVSWKLNACPMDGGSLAVAPTGQVLATWQSQGKIYLTPEDEETRLLGDGCQAWTAGGPGTVWTTSRTGKLMYRPAPDITATQLADAASDPTLTESAGQLICAWSANGKVYTAVISDTRSK